MNPIETKAISVAIADDHPVVRAGVLAIMSESSIVGEVCEYASAEALQAALLDAQWTVLILDINFGGTDGLLLLPELLAQKPGLGVLILSNYPEEKYALPALKAGAMGYINKFTSIEQLLEAVLQLGQGRRYIPPRLAELLATQALSGQNKPLEETLSDRELQVFNLLVSGKGNNEIAELLELSNKTVSTYRTRIIEKLNLNSTTDLISYGLTHGYGLKN